MTVDSTTNRKDYDPNGVVVAFPYDFRVDDADDMVVYEDGVVVVGGYTVSGVGEEAGGDVTFDVAPLDSVDLLTLIREVPLTQQTSYPALGPFPAGSHEAALDKLTFINQQQQEQLDRALLTTTAQGPLTVPDPEAGKVLQWKDDLSGFDNVVFDADAAVDAAASAAAAAASETAAGISETNAAASAAQAAIDAASVADKASVDEVAAFKDDAEAAAIAAGVSAAAANSSAITADLSASNASTSANFANGFAGNASDSADAAAASAAAAALYDPTWELWTTATLESGFTGGVFYRKSVDGKLLAIRGRADYTGTMSVSALIAVFLLPESYRVVQNRFIAGVIQDPVYYRPIVYTLFAIGGEVAIQIADSPFTNPEVFLDMVVSLA